MNADLQYLFSVTCRLLQVLTITPSHPARLCIISAADALSKCKKVVFTVTMYSVDSGFKP